MKRNRKSQSAAIRLVPAIKALFLCLFFGGAAVGYVWQQRKLHELGALQRTLEARLDLLRRENRLQAGHLASLQLPQRLQERVPLLHGNLVRSNPAQIVHLPEPVPAPEQAPFDALLADHPGTGVARLPGD
jgi:hypothetical protein